jgi:hypothetical protein
MSREQVAFKSLRAAEWELGVDEGDVACYINRRTGERSYDNPKIETTPPLTKKQVRISLLRFVRGLW